MRSVPIALLACFAALTPAVARAQGPDSMAVDQGARRLCFGVSFDRGCRVMFQYEVGVRSGWGRMPASEAPIDGYRRHPGSSLGSDLFVAAGVMVRRSPTTAVGVVLEQASYTAGQSLGVRYARRLRGSARIDLTAGLTTYDEIASFGNGGYAHTQIIGTYGEAALHGNNWFTGTLRADGFLPRAGMTGGGRVMVGARLERWPAVGVTAATLAFIALAFANYDCGGC